MKPPRQVSKTEKIIFPIIGIILTCFIVPTGLPLLGMLFFGNLLKESGVTKRLATTASGPLIDIVTILIGLTVGMMDLDALFAVGPESTAMAEAAQVNARIVVRHFPSTDALWRDLRDFLKPGDQVLVKGSRGMKMEQVVNHLLEWFPN